MGSLSAYRPGGDGVSAASALMLLALAAGPAPDSWELRSQGAGVVHCVHDDVGHHMVCERLDRHGVAEGEPVEVWWGDDRYRPILVPFGVAGPQSPSTDRAVIDWTSGWCRFPHQSTPGHLVSAVGCDVVVRWTADLSPILNSAIEVR